MKTLNLDFSEDPDMKLTVNHFDKNNLFSLTLILIWLICVSIDNFYIVKSTLANCQVVVQSKIESEIEMWRINSPFIINFDKLGGDVKDIVTCDFEINSIDGLIKCFNNNLHLEIHRFEHTRFHCNKNCEFNAWSSLILDSQAFNNQNVELSFTITRNHKIVMVKIMIMIKSVVLYNLSDLSEIVGDFYLEAKILSRNYESKKFDFSDVVLNYKTNIYINLINKIAIINDSPSVSICGRHSSVIFTKTMLIIIIPILLYHFHCKNFKLKISQGDGIREL